MKRVFIIDSADGKCRLSETDFPLSIGGTGADIVLPEAPDHTVAAHIALSGHHAYVQPASEDIELFHNFEHIGASAWLKSGDRVQVGERVICWDIKGDQVFIKVRHTDDPPELQPPLAPPPMETADADTEVMPVFTPPILPVKRHRLRYLIFGLFGLLSLVALFVLFATPLEVSVSPRPESMSVSGFPPPVLFGKRKLVIPGTYTVRASREGYLPLEQEFKVSSGGFQAFDFALEELPGRLHILVDPAVPFRVYAGGAETPVDMENMVSLARGLQQLSIETERYLTETLELDISGFGALQELNLVLRPAWARVRLESEPSGASVSVDGEDVGVTPLLAEIIEGQRTIEVSLAGYKSARLATEITAGTSLNPDIFYLEPNDGRLLLASRPEGATVSVNGTFYGATPVTLTLASGVPLALRLGKPGYKTIEKTIRLGADEEQQLSLDMQAEYGVVFVSSVPADASLMLDGKPAGSGTQRLRLTTRQHELTFSKPGYLPQTVKVIPRTDTSQDVDIVLKTRIQAKAEARPAVLQTASGQELRLLEPEGSFQMGASRREAGSRANESRRLVEITRPYYLATREVTNGEYRQFNPKHNSGTAEGVSLNNETQPVVDVSWDDAARYCNWLSERDKLESAYIEKDGQMKLKEEVGNGYRLPTEAEWVYAARISGRGTAARYPWGDGYPPVVRAGNFADAQIADTLANVVAGYNDGYRASAPVGSFDEQPAGFHDLGGNVAEWMNDYYAVYPGQGEKLVRDPIGPGAGDHHVVRGSSWRDGSITELRLSYRDYSRDPRDNLGFRIARYADE